MKRSLQITTLVFLIVGGLLSLLFHWAACRQAFDLVDFHKQLRGNLFAAFLTLGGFLLSMTTWIITRLHEKHYESDRYRKRHETMAALDKKRAGGLLDPLHRLTGVLMTCVLCSIGCAPMQLILAAASSPWAAAVACGFGLALVALAIFAWWLVWKNLRAYFDLLEA